MCRAGAGVTWGPAGGPGGRALPRLVGVLERGIQLPEALLERVALIVLHQLLRDTCAHCRCHRLQAVLPGALASLSHLGFTWGTCVLGPRGLPAPALGPARRPPRVGGQNPRGPRASSFPPAVATEKPGADAEDGAGMPRQQGRASRKNSTRQRPNALRFPAWGGEGCANGEGYLAESMRTSWATVLFQNRRYEPHPSHCDRSRGPA